MSDVYAKRRARGQAIHEGDGDSRHGTTNGYNNLLCRCQECRDAWAAFCREMKEKRRLPSDDPRHGLYTTYGNHKCRCRPCTDAWAAYYRDKRRT